MGGHRGASEKPHFLRSFLSHFATWENMLRVQACYMFTQMFIPSATHVCSGQLDIHHTPVRQHEHRQVCWVQQFRSTSNATVTATAITWVISGPWSRILPGPNTTKIRQIHPAQQPGNTHVCVYIVLTMNANNLLIVLANNCLYPGAT